MPRDPLELNFQVADLLRGQAQNNRAAQAAAAQAQMDSQTADKDREADILKAMIQNVQQFGDVFGGVGTGETLPNFDPRFAPLQESARTPGSFTRERDDRTLEDMEAGALQKIIGGQADGAAQGIIFDPQTGSFKRITPPSRS
jgi:uncharacterized protein YyaL (SSP411 family)